MNVSVAKFRALPLCFLISLVLWYLAFGFAPARLALDLENPGEGPFQVYYDMGAGFEEDLSQIMVLDGTGRDRTLNFLLPSRGIRGLRIDPGKVPGTVRIKAIRLTYALGNYRWDPADISQNFTPLNQIAGFAEKNGAFEVVTSGNDPYFGYVGNAKPVFELVRLRGRIGLFLAGLATAFLLCLLWPAKSSANQGPGAEFSTVPEKDGAPLETRPE